MGAFGQPRGLRAVSADPAAKTGGGVELGGAPSVLHGGRPWSEGRCDRAGEFRPRHRGRFRRSVAAPQPPACRDRAITGRRALNSAWGVPAEALIEPSRRDRVRGWFLRNGGEAAKLDAADAGGLAWTAVGLKVTHPDRPHRLTLNVKAGEPSALGVALVESSSASGDPSGPARLLLDACASGPPILQDGPAASFEWVVFPHASEMVLVMVNRSPEAEVRAGAITLSEIDETAAVPAGQESASRALGLYLTGSSSLDRFGAAIAGSSDPLRSRSEPREIPGMLRCHGRRPA